MTPTQDSARAFYKAALAAAQHVEPGLTDLNADTAWRAYGDDLPLVIRIDQVLRNLAMLYPAAFAPGPVFDLPGWYDDAPWGVGFERPPANELEALWRNKAPPKDAEAAFAGARDAWGLRHLDSALALREPLSPSTQIIVAGSAATITVLTLLAEREAQSPRAQVTLIGETPAPRQLLGIACALKREQGVPRLVRPNDKADGGVKDVGLDQAHLLVTSGDATEAERDTARRLAGALSVGDTIELEAG